MAEVRSRLLDLLRANSLKLGRFRLVSGAESYYYFDSKLTTLTPEGAYLSAKLILEEIRRSPIDAAAIGGLTLGADPLVAAVAAVSFAERDRYEPMEAFIIRKAAKDHGTSRLIEGYQGPHGIPVIIIDDVCTTGSSTRRAVEAAEGAGYRVVAILCLVDREQGGRAALADYPFYPIFTATELLEDPAIQARLAELKGQ